MCGATALANFFVVTIPRILAANSQLDFFLHVVHSHVHRYRKDGVRWPPQLSSMHYKMPTHSRAEPDRRKHAK